MSGLQRFKILLVRNEHSVLIRFLLTFVTDCPEREATYVITNGGISDPDKV